MRSIAILFLLLVNQVIFSQNKVEINWWNPANNEFPVVDGQGWPDEVEALYHRLPARVKDKVRKDVWDLSKQSAGLSIRFWTNADSIRVRYKVKGELSYKLISSLGVSGLDLYSKSLDGEWMRCWGNYDFNATTTCTFTIDDTSQMYSDYGREYQLFLPLFNEVETLEIGVSTKYILNPLPLRKEKPIVAYGTSICQGANASRPGMSWTNLLQRQLERPLINLGFSGNGRLEPEIVDLMAEIDAKLYILDCLPNLTPNKDDVYQLIINAVEKLRNKRPSTPIILTAHQGFSNEMIHAKNKRHSEALDEELIRAFKTLQAQGVAHLYMLEHEDLELDIDAYTDYGHPNDYGMRRYAKAYENLIRHVLHEPMGAVSTTIPITQSRDIATYNWEERHQNILEMNKTKPPRICLFGDSITNFWGGEPTIRITNGDDSWNDIMKPLGIRNFGFGYDRIENVLWRIYHDELDGFEAENIMLMIGVNNLQVNHDKEIIKGLELLIEAIKVIQPNSDIILLGLLPAVKKEVRIASLNEKMNQLAVAKGVEYKDIGEPLLLESGMANASLFTDGLHPNHEGYRLLAKQFQHILIEKK